MILSSYGLLLAFTEHSFSSDPQRLVHNSETSEKRHQRRLEKPSPRRWMLVTIYPSQSCTTPVGRVLFHHFRYPWFAAFFLLLLRTSLRLSTLDTRVTFHDYWNKLCLVSTTLLFSKRCDYVKWMSSGSLKVMEWLHWEALDFRWLLFKLKSFD